jgi:hypothetical protein
LRLDSWRGEIRSQVTEKAEILDSDVLVVPEQSQVVGRQWDGNSRGSPPMAVTVAIG